MVGFRKLEPQIPPISQILRRLLGNDRTNPFVAKPEDVASRKPIVSALCSLCSPGFRFASPWVEVYYAFGVLLRCYLLK
jgi:hypothetical protein